MKNPVLRFGARLKGENMTFLNVPSILSSWQTTLFFVLLLGGGALAFIFIKKYREEIAPKKRLEKNDHDHSISVLKKILGSYVKKHDGRVIYSIEVGSKKTKGSADAILIGYFGVLVLVGCDLSGDLYATDKEEHLTQVVKTERKQHDNPILQAKTAEKAVSELLREKKVYRVPVESAVVFTGSKVNVNVPGSHGSFSPKTLEKALSSKQYLEDKGVNTDAVAEAILSWR